MVVYKQAESLKELEQILDLQQRNLPKNISQEESTKEGFVTVEHTLDLLKSMNDVCGHIIAVDDGQVVGYALCMHPQFAEDIEVLRPMFGEIDKALESKLNYMAMGQICVAKSHRGQGIFRKLYQTMQEKLPEGFDTIITEVDGKNKRSLAAHTAIGFTTLTIYHSDGKEWHIIMLK
ncbi:GNAT family N-acetyltransferase [Flagellimonas marinaquae]|uniref:GNAT family N-acetyltransferase n=1 Tax=Flagellimonas aurea TaxID=2915619 RepID=A0ABS3G0K4_9FLAO|nr:GNAT family N-acetyltransferase [Allomuricauda aurea]MAO16131.1 GNAT family N-acetyltransferase [Allomuricauda sp.]MBO0352508.1 GNAT family N-acetyltransferase [Allomuricauda aurea]UBZ15522.1 GNAT family N-acetyltransferase [Allomuricauda aquimarina]|tara:strand:+ start:754 stop:1284 length:531 start_codon:yes stop_codon:yes gene_type:complete